MKLIPQPQQLELQEGTYRIGYQDRITLDAACSPAAYGYAKLLAGELEELRRKEAVENASASEARVLLSALAAAAQELLGLVETIIK